MASVMRFDQWEDSNGVPVASGAGGVFSAPGTILQVASGVRTSGFTTASTSFTDLTDATVTITPSSASNKVMVWLSVPAARISVPGGLSFAIIDRGGSQIGGEAIHGDSDSGYDGSLSVMFLDSPNTTSATTYKIRVKVNGGTGTFSTATITVMEVAA